ncbi:MAG: response regulator [Selenomonadales bacterium]|nr:response regulator [Selenomonadales bacterium]
MSGYLNKKIAMKYCGNSEKIYEDVLKSYAEQGYKYLDELADYIEMNNWNRYAIVAHALKNASKTIGALKLSDIALDMEMAGKAEDGAHLRARHQLFMEELLVSIHEAENALETLNKEAELKESVVRETKKIVKKVHDTNGTILVVDDDSTNLTLAHSFLSQEFKIIGVKSGKVALRYLQKNTPDLILLDLMMPEMDGFQVMEKLKEDYRLEAIPVIFLTADRSAETEEKCFLAGAMDYIGKPFVPAVMHQRVRRILELESYKHNLEKMVAEQLQKITQLQTDIIISMGNLVESRDGTTGEHIKRTAIYTEYLSKKAQKSGLYSDVLNDEFINYLCKAAPLHDIGKISVSDLILQKPGKLDNNEYSRMKLHTVEGDRIIRRNMLNVTDRRFVQMAADVARYHHEKWNGKGYPDRLMEDQIPLSARILAIADVFDALIAKRPYKDGFPFEKAVAIMVEERGKSFEPELLDLFVGNEEELRELVKKIN